jgi:SAM-dependent methyltransferase
MEGYGPETYGDAMADIYDLWYGAKPDTAAAVDRLASLAARTPELPVLELGVGTGRLALPLTARGVEVWGVDASSAMVQQLRDKPDGARVSVVVADMADLDLTPLPGGDSVRFGVAYVAINTFFNLTTRAAQARCLQRVHDLLADDGVFVLEAFVPAVDRPTNLVEARTVAVDHVILTATRHDPETQTVECQFIEIREAGIRLRPLTIRYCPPAELDAMAGAAGLALVERWSDWTGAPFTETDGTHVSLYARHG